MNDRTSGDSKRSTSARAGFSILEMLVVIMIIALLVALLLPTIGRARGQARMAVCASQLKQIYEGLENAELTARLAGNNQFQIVAPGWRSICRPYLRNSRVFICPEDYRLGGDDQGGMSGSSAGDGANIGNNPTQPLPGTPGSPGYRAPLDTLYIHCPQNQTDKECKPGPWVKAVNATGNSYQLMYEDGVDHNFTDVELLFTDNGDGTTTVTLLPNGNPGWVLDDLVDGSTGTVIWHQMYTSVPVGTTYLLQGSLIDPTTGTINTGGTSGTQGGISATNGGNAGTPGFGSESSYGMNGTAGALADIMGKGDKIFGLDYTTSLATIDDNWTVSPWLAPSGFGVAFARHNNQANVLWGDGSVRSSARDPYLQSINPQSGPAGGTYNGQTYTTNAQTLWFSTGEQGGY